MNATKPEFCKTDLTVIQVLSALLERLERSTVPVAEEQYQSVVRHLVGELGDLGPGTALAKLLNTDQGVAELYENVNYQHVKLCRSALGFSQSAERQAKEILDRAMSQTMSHLKTPLKEDLIHGKS